MQSCNDVPPKPRAGAMAGAVIVIILMLAPAGVSPALAQSQDSPQVRSQKGVTIPWAELVARHGEWLKAVGENPMLGMIGGEFLPREVLRDHRRLALAGGTLTGVNAAESDLRMADLSGSTIQNSDFSGANLEFALMAGMNFTGGTLDRAALKGAKLMGARLRGVSMRGAMLAQADLSGADLTGANLTGADLTGANLIGANLTGAQLSRARLTGADLSQSNLTNADLFAATLPGVLLNRAILRGANLTAADLSRSDLFGADLENAILMNADMRKANFLQSSLRGTRVFGARLEGTAFKGVDLTGVIFEMPAERFALIRNDLGNLARADNLGLMTFFKDDLPLQELRRLFKQERYRDPELAVTYAIRRGLRRQACAEGNLIEKAGCVLLLVMVELPIEYGAAPYRPFGIIIILAGLFGFIYMIPLLLPSERFGQIWIIKPNGRFFREGERTREEPLVARKYSTLLMGFWFSFTSAFHIGGKVFNVEDMFLQTQPSEFHLRATGVFRSLSGVQALISAYLLALALLIFFEKIAF